MKLRSAEVGIIGIIILACIPLVWFLVATFLWSDFRLFSRLYLAGLDSEFAFFLIRDGPFCALTIAGLASYVAGRKEFWKTADTRLTKILSFLLVAPFALSLIFWGFLFTCGAYGEMMFYIELGNPSSQVLLEGSPTLLLTILWFIAGIPLLVDSFRQLPVGKN